MAYNSIIDKYYDLIKGDAGYYKNWLRQHGTECILLVPKSESVKEISEIRDAYGDSQTYASTSLNYDESIVHLLIQPRDFSKVENGTESVLQTISPEKLEDGNIIKFRRNSTWFSFVVEQPVETFYNMLYRVTLRLMVPKSEAK